MTAPIVGSVSAPVEVLADPPAWAPAHGWRKQKNVEKREEPSELRRLERAEARREACRQDWMLQCQQALR